MAYTRRRPAAPASPSPAANRKSPMVPSPKPRRPSAGTGCSRASTGKRPSSGAPAARQPATRGSKCARCSSSLISRPKSRRPYSRDLPQADIHRAIDAVWRIESARLIATLARMVGDVGVAEDLAQDALVTALEKWPESGIPDKPGAWLMATAKNRAIDLLRRRKRLEIKHAELGRDLDAEAERAVTDLDAALDDDVGDDLLSLMFTACHPVLSSDARVALTLRLLGGLTTDEIARAFLV